MTCWIVWIPLDGAKDPLNTEADGDAGDAADVEAGGNAGADGGRGPEHAAATRPGISRIRFSRRPLSVGYLG